MTWDNATIAQWQAAAEVVDKIFQENEGRAHYNCPLCGGEICSISDHDPACQYAEYLKMYYPGAN